MTKEISFKDGFTLIEVMIAVMIISVVIMALIQMYANNTHIFISLKSKIKTNQYSSFLMGNEKYGFENKSTTLYDLLSDFDMRDELRRKLKNTKIKVIYSELDVIDLSESTDATDEEITETPEMSLEIGTSTLKTDAFSVSLLRVRLQ
ncbi:MAG: prepilin-type N-terminal cleavage/methylation domain-containing protein [Sulfurimonas sp.]|jgi:prepilin-type N-terminal cleavage/methylation domain-containing protein|uniref:type IV pilus modification PilV family protein n=1 Tax=Sulfurimonas sp. TaxID=2022749 RepID=UPI0039E34379